MDNEILNPEIEEFEEQYNSEEKVRAASREVEERLWEKVERIGKRITFGKDLLALYKYLFDDKVSWHRKAIVAGALIYFIAPIDAIPDLAPLFGYLDDLGVITATLKFLGNELVPYYDA